MTMVRWAVLVAGVMGGVWGSGCGGSSEKAGTIGASGGTVRLADGTQVTIGAGALTSPTVITAVIDDSAPAPAGVTEVGHPYRFGPEGQQFAVPVDVTIAFDVSKLPTTSSAVSIYTAPVGSTVYTALTTTRVDATHVQAATSHFSIFVAVVANNSPDMSPSDSSSSSDFSGVDLAGVDLAGSDLSATIDMAMSIDLEKPTDLEKPADLSGCYYTMTGGGGSCTLTESCDGHAYKLNCQNGSCTCTTDGTSTQTFISGTCPPGWTKCGYPGGAGP